MRLELSQYLTISGPHRLLVLTQFLEGTCVDAIVNVGSRKQKHYGTVKR